MKKIIITTALLIGSTLIFAQQSKLDKQNPTSKEDPHNPLVNGIPYNQYKLQVQAENKKKSEAEAKAKADQKLMVEKINQAHLPPIENGSNKQKAIQKESSSKN